MRAAGLSVSCICTPLLKWSPPGKASQAKGDQFGFELGDRTPGVVYAQAFEAAEVLGARNLRIFSYLTYDGYRVDDLREPIDDLLALAEKFDMKLHVENEGVCNIAGFAELEALVTTYRHPRLRALPDIANAYRQVFRRLPPIWHDCCLSRTSCTSRTTTMRPAASSPLARATFHSRPCWLRHCPRTTRR